MNIQLQRHTAHALCFVVCLRLFIDVTLDADYAIKHCVLITFNIVHKDHIKA